MTRAHRPSTALVLLALVAPVALVTGPACGPAPAGSGAPGEAAATGRGLVIVSPPSPIVSPGQEDRRADRPYFHDFGHVAYGEVVEHVFRIRNTDPVPVVVRDLLPSCGCTTPRMTLTTAAGALVRGSLAGEPVITIPSGVEAELLVRVDTQSLKSFNVDKLETVRLRCDSEHTPFLSFELHVLVRRLFQAEPPAIALGNVPASVGARESTRVTSFARGTQAALTGVAAVEGPLRASVSEGLLLDTPIWTLVVEVEPGLPLGALAGRVHLAALDEGGRETEPFVIEVDGQIVADVVLDPPALHFVRLGATSATRVEARLKALVPGSRVAVLAGTLDGPAADRLRFEAVAVDPDAAGRAAEWRVVLSADPSLAGTSFAGTLTIALDDPVVPEIAVRYSSSAAP